jgi:hypothetical protein
MSANDGDHLSSFNEIVLIEFYEFLQCLRGFAGDMPKELQFDELFACVSERRRGAK